MKNCLIKLKSIFAFRNYYKLCHLLVIFSICLIYSLVTKKYYLLVVNLFLVILCLKNKSLIYSLIIIVVILTSRIIITEIIFNQLNEGPINCNATVYKVENKLEYQKVYIKIKKGKLYFISKDLIYQSGDQLHIIGNIERNTTSHTPGSFNYQKFLKYQNIYGKVVINNVYKIGSKFAINSLHESVSKYLYQHYDDSYNSILAALLIGNKDRIDDDLQNKINQIGISHLFVISGLHIEVISKALFLGLNKFKLKKELQNIIVFGVLIFYYILTSLMVSILRVMIGFIFNNFLKKQLKILTVLDRYFFNILIVLLINPYYLFSYSFLLTYVIVFGILLISRYLKREKTLKNFIYNNILISFTSTLISMPIIVNISNEINFLSIMYNLFYIPFITYLVLPLSFLIIICPPIKIIYHYLYSFFVTSISFCSKIDFFTFSFSRPSSIFIFIYYLFFILSTFKFKKKIKITSISIYILLIIIWLLSPYFRITNEIHFLNLPNGDSTLITTNNQLTNILIDTGDVDAEELVGFLKRKGIKKLDGVIISHGDTDHIGGLDSLINEFKIENIYIGIYDYTSIRYLSNIKKINIHLVKTKDIIKINNLSFNVLGPNKNYDDINNNSLVLLGNVFGIKILFTGDIEKKAELDLIKIYPYLKFDILKIAHHGSNTSSSIELLNNYKFKIAVGMNGYMNQFSFPSELIVKRFNNISNVKIFNTVEYGTISIKQNPISKKIKFSFSYKNS